MDEDNNRAERILQRAADILANTEAIDDLEERARQNRLERIMSPADPQPKIMHKTKEDALLQPSLEKLIDARIQRSRGVLKDALGQVIAHERKKMRAYVAEAIKAALVGVTLGGSEKRLDALLTKLEAKIGELVHAGDNVDGDWRNFPTLKQ